MPLPEFVMEKLIDALAVVVARLDNWGASMMSAHNREWMRRGQAAVLSRDETEVRRCLAECALVLDELADAKDDRGNLRPLELAHEALTLVHRVETAHLNRKAWA